MYVYTQRVPGDVPGAVHALLLATKQLQELLRLWSVKQASETDVSDCYVQLGTQFNTTVHAFSYHKIDVSDLLEIPQSLRTVLEQCLAEEPSRQTLESFLPAVRGVIYRLLKGLQHKQEAWRAVSGQRLAIPSPDGR
ncbi:hypothetical protein C8J56DRAFT_791227 [Mycena floridula]|nr:hypothetical protein C8J56DRAFT_791227 [Mycena floridula]